MMRSSLARGALLVGATLLSACAAPVRPAAAVPWLVGDWSRTDADGARTVRTEERWAALSDGTLLGSGRVVVDGLLGFAETLAVTGSGDALVYTAWIGGQAPVDFPATSLLPGEVTFTNPAHDFPQAIRYRLTPSGELEATASGPGPDGPREESWTLSRPTP